MLKSGTRIEDRRLREADALINCLAFDAVTAWNGCAVWTAMRGTRPTRPFAEVQ